MLIAPRRYLEFIVAHHKDALKRIKQNEKRRMRNRSYRTQMRNHVKAVRDAVEAGDVEQAQAKLRAATAIIHRVSSRGIIHSNNAARRISRLNAAVKKLATA